MIPTPERISVDADQPTSPAPPNPIAAFAEIVEWFKEMQTVAESIRPMFASLNRTAEELRQKTLGFADDIREATSNAAEMFNVAGAAHAEFYKLMPQHGWPPLLYPEWGVVFEVVKRRLDLDDQAFQAWLDARIVAYHPVDQISEILRGWEARPCLSGRLPILRRVVAAHLVEDYALTVPALLPQIEGLLLDLFDHKGWMSEKKVRRYMRMLVRGEELTRMRRWIRHFVENVFYAKFRRGDCIPEGPSRAAILHGTDMNYPSEANSLKVILAFDLLSGYATFASRLGIATYHRVGCPLLDPPDSTIMYFDSGESAMKRGFTPCPTCCSG